MYTFCASYSAKHFLMIFKGFCVGTEWHISLFNITVLRECGSRAVAKLYAQDKEEGKPFFPVPLFPPPPFVLISACGNGISLTTPTPPTVEKEEGASSPLPSSHVCPLPLPVLREKPYPG